MALTAILRCTAYSIHDCRGARIDSLFYDKAHAVCNFSECLLLELYK